MRLLIALLALSASAPAALAACDGPPRKINIGVAVTPPNVVHTPPFVAKGLGYFAARCIDANIMQFEGGASAAAVSAVSQGVAIGPLTEAAIAQGVKGKQVWEMAPRLPQDYFVAAGIAKPADLKGKRLSAAGGIGAFNWVMGREMLHLAGLTVNDASFVSQGLAGRLPGLLTGQLDGVALHPEDVYLAEKKKPGLHSLASLGDVLPNYSFNAYSASDAFIAANHDLLVDTLAAMIEANRTLYQDRAKVLPIILQATQKPQDAVVYALDSLTKRCVWAVNTGFDPQRTQWSIAFATANGDIDKSKHPRPDDIIDMKIAAEALAKAGGPVTIGNCKD